LPHDQSFDLILLCHTLSARDCGIAREGARTRWPEASILALSIGGAGCPEYADRTIRALEGPRRLIERLLCGDISDRDCIEFGKIETTAASGQLESLPALYDQDLYTATLIFDQATSAKSAHGDGGAASTQHLAEKVLSQVQLRFSNSVGYHQEPTRQPLFHLVNSITCRDLTEHKTLILHLPQHSPVQALIMREPLANFTQLHAECSPFHLHYATGQPHLRTKQVNGPRDTLPPDEPDLDGSSARHYCGDRGHPAQWRDALWLFSRSHTPSSAPTFHSGGEQ
jgi:hypothetical protein